MRNFIGGNRSNRPDPKGKEQFDPFEEALGKKFFFSETRTALGERAYVVQGAVAEDEPEIVVPAHYNGSPVVRIENRAFCGNTALMKAVLPSGLLSIGVFAFAFCGNLTEIVLPESLITLGGRAFYGCCNLSGINLGSRLKAVRNGLFVGCKALKELTVPDSVVGIGNEAFSYCENLERLSLGGAINAIGENAFVECAKLKEIEFRDGREKWNRIKKDATSAKFLRGVCIRCTDGEIKPF